MALDDFTSDAVDAGASKQSSAPAPRKSAIDDFSSSSFAAASAAPVGPPFAGMPTMPAKGAPSIKPGSDPYSDALYAKTGSGNYDRPGESLQESYSRNSTYDQKMRDAGRRHAPDSLQVVGSIASGVGGAVAGGINGIYSGLKSLVSGEGVDAAVDKAADSVRKTQQALAYTPTNPESRAVTDLLASGANPLNWPAMGGDYVGGKLADHGMPGLGTIVATAGAALPMVLGMPKVQGAIARTARGSSLADLMRPPAPPVPKVEPTLDSVTSNPGQALAPTPQTAPVAANPGPHQAAPGRAAPLAGGPQLPAKPTFSDPANNVFADSAPDTQGGLSASDQAKRVAVLKEVGIDQVRRSAVTGDANQAAIDFQTSRMKGSPAGDAMSQQLSSEKQAIADYADGIAQKTGGSSLNDQSAKLARGEAILTPLEGLKDWFDNQTSALYKTADTRAQGVPTQLDNFRTVLGDDSLATNSDRVNLRTAAGAYAKKLGIVDDSGNVFANAQQAETMRKYLNENWSPQNSGLVGKLKDALDQDVMSAAGEDVYGQARALRAQRAATLDNPNGIAKLLDSSGPQGVNRAVPVEKVADALTNMPVAQLKNIVGTLKNMPPELQPMAQDALAEIKAQYAHNVKDIGSSQQGQWNAKGVQKYLSNNSARMGTVFEPDEMQRFGTLNDAGNILAKDQSYPGAYAQQQNLLRAGVSHAITGGSTALGSLAGHLGAVAGSVVGGKMSGKFNDASALRAAQNRLVNLRDIAGGHP